MKSAVENTASEKRALEPKRGDELPVAVIGAGWVGLAMADHLAGHGRSFIVNEAEPEAGHAICQWQHVRLFTEWQSN